MKAVKRIIVTLLCLAIVSGGGYAGYSKYQKNKDDKRIVNVVPVNMLATNYWADEKTVDASVSAGNSQSVYLDDEKLVKELNVSLGDTVKKGDVILTYDMTVVDLEIEQQKNQIAVIDQQIKEEERNLQKLRNLKPSELAPNEPDYPNYPEEPEEPQEPEEPEDPVQPEEPEEPEQPEAPMKKIVYLKKLVDIKQASELDDKGNYVFNCKENSVVTRTFMSLLKSTGKNAVINVYDSEGKIIYIWQINGASVKSETIEDWTVGDGVVISGGMISFDSQNYVSHGIFMVYTAPDDKSDDDMTDTDNGNNSGVDDDDISDDDDDLGDDIDMDDDDGYDDGFDDNLNDDISEDYMYSRSELAIMVKEKESQIKALKLDRRSAKLQYKNNVERKSDGRVVAEMDGVVTRLGSAESQSGGYEDMGFDEEFEDDIDSEGGEDFEDAESGKAYIVIQGEEGVCIDIQVGELNLDKFEIGTVVTGMSYETGESFSAEVISVEDEPLSYSSYMWNENPNSSTYTVRASVLDETSLTVGNWVTVTMPEDEQASSGLYIPMQYVHRDGGSYYVMKADKKGRLKKQYIKSGKVIWGSYLEVLGGITYDDKICFPYGKDVKEGVRTKDSEEILY